MRNCVLRFPATLEGYEQAFDDLRQALDTHDLRAKGRYNVELVFEEIVSNIIRHGCGYEVDRAVEVSVGFEAGVIVISFDDNGPPFDPRAVPAPQPANSLDDVRVGGLGLMLVRNASAQMEYERTAQEKNRLTVTITAR